MDIPKHLVLISESESFRVYRDGDVVIKTFHDPEKPHPDDIVVLQNEYNILKRLTMSDNNRVPSNDGDCRCIEKIFNDGGWRIRSAISNESSYFPKSLSFKYTPGVTLRKWCQENSPPPKGSSKTWVEARTAVKIMREMAAAIGSMHASGVVHHNLTMDHIIVDDSHNSVVVTIIGFGHASLFACAEKDDNGEISEIHDDIYDLGVIYQDMVEPSEAPECDGNHENKEEGDSQIDSYERRFTDLAFMSRQHSFNKMRDSFRDSFIKTKLIPSQLDIIDWEQDSQRKDPLDILRDLIGALVKNPGSPVERYKSAADIEAELVYSILPFTKN